MRSSSPLRILGGALLGALLAACAQAPRAAPPPVALEPGEHQRILNGVRLYYRIAGEPPPGRAPVLFLHGGPGYNSYSFARVMGARLEQARRMVYLDQRGCGRSERPWDRSYSLAVLVEDVEALRQALGVERWVLLGHSFGGTLALEYAARYPERVAGLVLVGGLSDAPASFAVWKRELERLHPGRLTETASAEDGSDYTRVMQALRGLDTQAFFHQLQFRDDASRQRQEVLDAESGLRNTGELSQALFSQELLTYRFSAHARLATVPALLIGGRFDRAIGVENMKALAQALPRASFLEYEQSAHFPYLEEAERFERDVRTFLEPLP
jgi:proline iminopeptidase